MKQPDLFEPLTRKGDSIVPPPEWQPPLARSTDPVTSHAAADDAELHASPGRLLALRALRKWGPMTDFDLARETGWQQTSIGKRRGECCAAGLVEPWTVQGTRMTKAAPSGSQAQLWIITLAGVEFLRDEDLRAIINGPGKAR